MSEKVSIVTPCFNGESYIDRYMKTIFNLEYDNIQLIIVDDGSTDGSYKKLKQYSDSLAEHNIEYILVSKKNEGQSAAFNCGVKRATGKYLVWPIDSNYTSIFLFW